LVVIGAVSGQHNQNPANHTSPLPAVSDQQRR